MNLAQALRSRTMRIAVVLTALLAAGTVAYRVLPAFGISGGFFEPAQAQAAPREVTVSNAAQLSQAIRSARGRLRVLLEPGEYGPLVLHGVLPPQEVVITSRDPSRRATLREVHVRDGGNLTFTDLVLKASGTSPQEAFLFQGVRNLKFERLFVTGQDGAAGLKTKLILLRDTDNASITGSEFTHAWIAVSLLDTRHVSIRSNYFHGLEMDGVRGGGNSNIVIAHNYFTNFQTVPPAHPDAIQFWTTNQKTSAHDITIVGNVIVRGAGRPVQGIFMNDEVKTLPYRNLRIEDNVVIGAMYNGIAVAQATGMTIVNNTVSAFGDQKSWIRVGGEMDLRNNRAPIYLIDGKRVKEPDGNEVIQVADDGGVGAIRAWADGRSLADYHGNLRSFVAELQ